MRSSSELSYRSRINAVVDHVYANLAEPLDGSVLARQASLSAFHFHRVFHELTGLTPAEYVEYARLGTAVVRLRQTDRPVGRIAESVGYESGTSLAKAMRRRFGIVPGTLRGMEGNDDGTTRRLDLSAFLRPKPPGRLRPRFTQLPTQTVLCVTEHGMTNHQAHDAFARAESLLDEEVQQRGLSPSRRSKLLLIGSAPAHPDDADFPIIVGAPVGETKIGSDAAPGRTQVTVIGGRYAVFRHIGPRETHWQSWFSIFHNWVPSAAALVRPGPPFQCAVEDESGKPCPLLTDFYLPIV